MLPSLVETYCVHMEAEGPSAKTIALYRFSLKKFFAWLSEKVLRMA